MDQQIRAYDLRRYPVLYNMAMANYTRGDELRSIDYVSAWLKSPEEGDFWAIINYKWRRCNRPEDFYNWLENTDPYSKFIENGNIVKNGLWTVKNI